jgi:uncharacterized RDD family membrane protein YckC
VAIRVGRLEVETPDHVVLRYTLAGVGNRGFAAVVDFLVAFLITAGLEIGYAQIGAPGEAVLSGVIRLLLFVLGWSYFILLEWLWNGQTVGKRAFGLRVINEDGSPAGFVAVFVRNLVRMIDFLPAFYGLGLLSIVLTSRSQRLGDFAAGTYVVRAPKPQLDWLALRTVTRPDAPVATAGVRGLSGEAQRIVREFVAREGKLSAGDRARLATEIASRIRPFTSGIVAVDDLAFLRAVAATLREAGERRG